VKFGKIDILVNCAGISAKRYSPVVELNEEDWRLLLDVNLTGSFLISKPVAKDMIRRKEGGKIVHISSNRGKEARAFNAPYSASKFGVIGLTQSLALELAPYKINVNAICPGYTITNIRDEWCKEQSQSLGITIDEVRARCYEEWSANVPLGRMGTTDDVANLVLFLVSSQSAYMTGQAINITGGLLMR
jgi:NAD(P)-dependent dehydrogenase (short-subunit alcohol dehydrogenase family)